MSIHNVTSTSLDHICSHIDRTSGKACEHKQIGKLHTMIEQVKWPPDDQHPNGQIILVIECAAGHRECLNNDLLPEEETSETRSEASREQIKNVRALHRHLGLPVKD